MEGPVRHKPMALCDPRSVKQEQLVDHHREDGHKNLRLKYSDDHKWYYFPDMTNDEVLCFTQYVHMKGVDEQPDGTEADQVKSVFHMAIDDPRLGPNDAVEERKSCEYRV